MTPRCPNVTANNWAATEVRLPSLKPSGSVVLSPPPPPPQQCQRNLSGIESCPIRKGLRKETVRLFFFFVGFQRREIRFNSPILSRQELTTEDQNCQKQAEQILRYH